MGKWDQYIVDEVPSNKWSKYEVSAASQGTQLQPSPKFSNKEEADKALKRAKATQRQAQLEADFPIFKAASMIMSPIVNSSLGGIPDIVSRNVDNKPFVPEETKNRLAGDIIGLASPVGVGGVLSKVGGRLIPKTAGIVRKIAGGAATGALGGALTPGEDARDIDARLSNAKWGAGLGGALPVAGEAIKQIPKGLKATSSAIHNSIVKLPNKAFRFSKDPLDVLNKEAIKANSTADYANIAKIRLSERSKQLENAISNSFKEIDADSIITKHLNDAASKSTGSLKDRSAGIKELEFMKENIFKKYGNLKNLRVQDAIKLKRQLADDFPFIAEDPNNINTKAAHKIYHDLNEAIEAVHPEIKELNHRVSGLIDISHAAMNRAAAEARNPFSFIDKAIAVGGISTGNPVGAAALYASKKALSSPYVKTRLANTLSKLSGVSNKIPSGVIRASAEIVRPTIKPKAFTGITYQKPIRRTDRMLPSPKQAGQSTGPTIPIRKTREQWKQELEQWKQGRYRQDIRKEADTMRRKAVPENPKAADFSGTGGNEEKRILAEKMFGNQVMAVGGIGIGAKLQEPDRLKLPAIDFTATEEGFSGKKYKDSNGHWTIGHGFKIEEPHVRKLIPIAVLSGKRQMTKSEARSIIAKLYPIAEKDAKSFAGNRWDKLTPNQRKGLTDMAYQLGGSRLNGFHELKKAIQAGDSSKMYKEVLNSKYARKDAPNRARRVAELMKSQ